MCSIRVHCKNDFVILTNCLLHLDGCSIRVVKLIELLEVSAVPVELTKGVKMCLPTHSRLQ